MGSKYLITRRLGNTFLKYPWKVRLFRNLICCKFSKICNQRVPRNQLPLSLLNQTRSTVRSEVHPSSYFRGAMRLIRMPERRTPEVDRKSKALECGPLGASESSVLEDLMETEVQRMIDGRGYNPKPLRSWRKCPFIQASRKREFRPVPDGVTPEIRHLPEHVRTLLSGCKVFQPQQIAEYNCMLQSDGKLVSGIDHLKRRDRVKPGRLYHKFDSLCALATSKAGRLLLIQHRALNHVFYAIAYDPAHKLYIELLNMYERRWGAVSKSYGKDDFASESE